jgi:hypothetical protein
VHLILPTIASLLIATIAAAETPKVCQIYFDRETFADNALYEGKSEMVALLSNLATELPPSFTDPAERNLVFDFFTYLFYEDVDDARLARISYETTMADFADGEITYEAAQEMMRTMHRVQGVRDTDAVVQHIGTDHPRAADIIAVTDCYSVALEMMSDDYFQLHQQLARYFLVQGTEESE